MVATPTSSSVVTRNRATPQQQVFAAVGNAVERLASSFEQGNVAEIMELRRSLQLPYSESPASSFGGSNPPPPPTPSKRKDRASKFFFQHDAACFTEEQSVDIVDLLGDHLESTDKYLRLTEQPSIRRAWLRKLLALALPTPAPPATSAFFGSELHLGLDAYSHTPI
jgi:hypothetical protein